MSQIKDVMSKKYEPKKERKIMGTLMPAKDRKQWVH
jgi:hypothetical protein